MNHPLSPEGKSVDDRIRVAIIWANLFVREAKRELRRKENKIIRASAHTVAAIESIFDLSPQDLALEQEARDERRTNG